MMFRGQFSHTIDVKGRVSLPARFRDSMLAGGDGRFVLTPAPFDPCLHLYPMRAWEEFEQKISELPSLDPNIVRFRRIYVSAATECELDKSGRVLVPPHLRDKAELAKDVLWAGMGRILELWSQERWDTALSMTAEEQTSFKQAVMEQIRI
jgi:MraZ protein